jgi:hypothetical protein
MTNNSNDISILKIGNVLWIKKEKNWQTFQLPSQTDEQTLMSFAEKVRNKLGFSVDLRKVADAVAHEDYVRPTIHFPIIEANPLVVTAPLSNPLSKIGKEDVLFSVAFAKVTPQSKSLYLIFDELGRTRFSRNNFALEELNEEEVLTFFNKNRDQAGYIIKKVERYFQLKFRERGKEEEQEDIFKKCASFLTQRKRVYKIVPALKDPSFLQHFNWREEIVERIANWGGVKDERLVLIHKAQLLRGIRPQINPHALTVTPPGTGKTTFYEKIGVNLGRVTAKSFLGFAKSPEDIYPGIIDGLDEPINVDEIENEGSFFIAQHLNNILESGHDKVGAGAVLFEVNCKSIFNFSANPSSSSKDPAKNFGTLISRLSSNPSIGRRVALLLYIPSNNNKGFKQISSKLSKEEEEEWKNFVELFRMVEEYSRPKIEKIIDLAWPWINTPMEWYEKEVLHTIEQYEGEAPQNVLEFLKAHVYATSRIRAGSLFIAIVNNLDSIALMLDISKEFVDELVEEAEDYLQKLLEINLQSIANIAQALNEELDSAAHVFYESAPEYLKVILEACTAYKSKNNSAEKVLVNSIPYNPKLEGYEYISKAIDHLKKRKRINTLLENCEKYFGIDLVFEGNDLFAYYINQNYLKIKPRGELIAEPLSKAGEIVKSVKDENSEKEPSPSHNFKEEKPTNDKAKIDRENGETKNFENKAKTKENEKSEKNFTNFTGFTISQALEKDTRKTNLEDKPELRRTCANCKYWDGPPTVTLANCLLKGESTTREATCNKFEPREAI